jgi:replicative DNA helicase
MKKETSENVKKTDLPNNFLAEQAVLNILLTNPNLIKNVTATLTCESFYFKPHKLIYTTLCELTEELQTENINLTIIITALQDKGRLKKIGGIERIISTISNFENFSDLENYIQLVNEKYLRRLIIEFGKQVVILGYTTSLTIEHILEEIERTLLSLNQKNKGQKFYSIAEIINDVFIEMKNKIKEDKKSGLLTSFKDLDSILQGIQKSDLFIIAGRPSMGKTAFSLNIGKNIVANYKIPLIVFSLEMSRQQIIYRFLASHSEINSNRLKSGKMTLTEWKKVSQSMKEFSELPIFIDDNPNLELNNIRSRLRKILTNQNKEAIVIIDYLQLMKSNLKLENRVQEISYITRDLKIIAKEFDIPIILLSQLSRNVETRINKRPMLSDLRESGSIEQDADVVIMIYREDYYNENQINFPTTEFIIAKHRNGPIGTARLKFNAKTTNFNNI